MKNKKNIIFICITVIIFYFSKQYVDRKNTLPINIVEDTIIYVAPKYFPITWSEDRKIFYQEKEGFNGEDKIKGYTNPAIIGNKYVVLYNDTFIDSYDMERKWEKSYTKECTIDIYSAETNQIVNKIDLKEIINESEIDGWNRWGHETVALIDDKSYFITWLYKSTRESGGWRDTLIIKVDVESGEIEKIINDEMYGDYRSYMDSIDQKYVSFLTINKSSFHVCYMLYNDNMYHVRMPIEALEREFADLYKIFPEVRKYRNVADIQRIDFYMDKDTEMIQIIDLFIEDEMKEQFYENYLEAGGTEEEYERSEYKMVVDEYLAYKESKK